MRFFANFLELEEKEKNIPMRYNMQSSLTISYAGLVRQCAVNYLPPSHFPCLAPIILLAPFTQANILCGFLPFPFVSGAGGKGGVWRVAEGS